MGFFSKTQPGRQSSSRIPVDPEEVAARQLRLKALADLRKAKKAEREAKWAEYRAEREKDPRVRAMRIRSIVQELRKVDSTMSKEVAEGIAIRALDFPTKPARRAVVEKHKRLAITAGSFRRERTAFLKRVRKSERERSRRLTEASEAVSLAERMFHGERQPTPSELKALIANYVATCQRLRRLFLRISRARARDEANARKRFGVNLILLQGAMRMNAYGVQLQSIPSASSLRAGDPIVPGGPIFRPPAP